MKKTALLLPLLLILCGCLLEDNQKALDSRVEASLAEQEWDKQNILKTQLNPKEANAFSIDYAKHLYQAGRYDEAVKLLDNLRKDSETAPEAYHLLALVYEKQNKPELALIAWQELRERSNTDYTIDNEVARSALLCSRYDIAEEIYISWMSTSTPNDAIYITGLNNLGFSFLLQERYDEAENLFNEALTNDPLNIKARANLDLLKTIR